MVSIACNCCICLRTSLGIQICPSVLFFVLFNAIFKFIDKCIKLWKITERDKGPVGYNLKDEDGQYRDIDRITSLQVSL